MDLTCNCHSLESLYSVPSLRSDGQHMHPLHSWAAFLGCIPGLSVCVSSVSVTPSPSSPSFFTCVCPETGFLHTTTILFHVMCLETFSWFRSALSSQLCLSLLSRSSLFSGLGDSVSFFPSSSLILHQIEACLISPAS